MAYTRVALIRHGETLWNATGRWQGHAAIALNDEGKRQAALLADYLGKTPDAFAAIYSSDLSRAAITAQMVSQKIGKPVLLDPRLREIDLGEWQGLTHEDIRAWDGERYARIQLDPHHTPRPGGESPAQVSARAQAALYEMAAAHKGGYVLAFTHGGTIRSLLIGLKLITPEARVMFDNTSITILRHEEGHHWAIEGMNLLEHLGTQRTVPGGNEG